MNKSASGMSDQWGDPDSGPPPRLPKHLPSYFQGPVTPRFKNQLSEALMTKSRFWSEGAVPGPCLSGAPASLPRAHLLFNSPAVVGC